MPNGATYNTMPRGIKYTPAGTGGQYADPLQPVFADPRREAVLPRIMSPPMRADAYMRMRYPQSYMPYPTGMTIPLANTDPIRMGVQFGLLGAAGGLGWAGVSEGLRRWHGDQGEPMGGGGVLKHMLVGGLIGTALGALGGYQLRNQALHPGSWDEMNMMLQRRANMPSFSPPSVPKPPVEISPTPVPELPPKIGSTKLAVSPFFKFLGRALGPVGAIMSYSAAKNNILDAGKAYAEGNNAAGDASSRAVGFESAMIPMSYYTPASMARGAVSLPVIERLAAKFPALMKYIEKSPALAKILGWGARGTINTTGYVGTGLGAIGQEHEAELMRRSDVIGKTIPEAKPFEFIDYENLLKQKAQKLPSWLPPEGKLTDRFDRY